MKKNMLLTAGLLSVICAAPAAFGVLIVSVDMDPLTPGVQDTLEVAPFEVFTVELVIELTEPFDVLSGYQIDITNITSEMTPLSGNDTLPASWIELVPGVVVGPGSVVKGFGGGTLNQFFFLSGPDEHIAGNITYEASGAVSDIGVSDIFIDIFSSLDGNFGTINPAFIVFNHGSIVPTPGGPGGGQGVPEPLTATLGLMGLAVLGMATRRRAA